MDNCSDCGAGHTHAYLLVSAQCVVSLCSDCKAILEAEGYILRKVCQC